MNESEIIKLCTRQRNTSKRGLSAQYENNISCRSFYNADQMTYSDQIQFLNTWGRKVRAMVNFNKVQPVVDAVVGFAAQNRRQAKFAARLPNDPRQNLYSKNMNALYGYTRDHANADYLETEQDLDLFVCGVGAIDTDVSYIIGQSTTMPNGEIVKMKLDIQNTGWDPSSKGINLLDSRWSYYWQDYDLDDALDLFQGSKEDDFQTVNETDATDTGYVYNPYGGIYDKIKLEDSVEWASREQQKVRVYNHQFFIYETFYKAENPLYAIDDPNEAMYAHARLEIIKNQVEDRKDSPDGIKSVDAFDFDPLAKNLTFDDYTKRLLVKEFGDLIAPVAFKRKCFYTVVYSGDHVFTWFKSISQQGFSIKFKTGTYNESDKIWVGMVNAMMEPQKYYNKALTELMFTIAANSKGGVMVEEDAVEDIQQFEEDYARTDAVIVVRSGALSTGKIQGKERPAVPTGLENIITLSEQGINSTGVDPSFMGDLRGGEEQAGVLYKRRIRQIISKFARYFDSITLAQKEDARLCADLIRVWVQNNEGEWVRITGPDGADEFLKISEDLLAPDYDVTIQEAPQTPEDEQQTAAQLTLMGDKLSALQDPAGKAFYLEAINKMPLDGDVRTRLSRALQGDQQQAAMLQQQLQAAQQQIQQLQGIIQSGEVDKIKSETEKNRATAMKTMSDIDLNKAKVPNTHADTTKKLEEAQRTAVEAAVAATQPKKEVNVNV